MRVPEALISEMTALKPVGSVWALTVTEDGRTEILIPEEYEASGKTVMSAIMNNLVGLAVLVVCSPKEWGAITKAAESRGIVSTCWVSEIQGVPLFRWRVSVKIENRGTLLLDHLLDVNRTEDTVAITCLETCASFRIVGFDMGLKFLGSVSVSLSAESCAQATHCFEDAEAIRYQRKARIAFAKACRLWRGEIDGEN